MRNTNIHKLGIFLLVVNPLWALTVLPLFILDGQARK